MPNMTLSIPDALQKKMKMHSEIRWSEVVRKSIADKISDLELMEKITQKSKLSLAESHSLASKINREVFNQLNK